MMTVLNNKKGMTLMELMVGLLLFIIITTIVAAVLTPMLRGYAKAAALAECNTLLDNVANQIIRDITNATEPIDGLAHFGTVLENTLSITADNPNDIIYTVNAEGVLLKNAVPVLSKTYYKNRSVSFTCTRAGSSAETAYALTITIYADHDAEIMQRTYAARPLVLNQYVEMP